MKPALVIAFWAVFRISGTFGFPQTEELLNYDRIEGNFALTGMEIVEEIRTPENGHHRSERGTVNEPNGAGTGPSSNAKSQEMVKNNEVKEVKVKESGVKEVKVKEVKEIKLKDKKKKTKVEEEVVVVEEEEPNGGGGCRCRARCRIRN